MANERDLVDSLVRLGKSNRTKKQEAEETIALGLLVYSKWDRARFGQPAGHTPTPAELDQVTFTDAELGSLRASAAAVLDDHKHRGLWKRDLGIAIAAGLISAFLWSGIVFGLGLYALVTHGGDIGDLILKFLSGH